MAADGVEQPGLDRRLVGPGIGRRRQPDRAEPAALGRADRGGRGIEADLGVGLDALGEQRFDLAQFDRGGGQDPRARGGAGDLGDREPFAAGQRRGRVEPEAAPADRLPLLAGGVAAARQAVGEGEGDGGGQVSASSARAGVTGATCDASAPAFAGEPISPTRCHPLAPAPGRARSASADADLQVRDRCRRARAR